MLVVFEIRGRHAFLAMADAHRLNMALLGRRDASRLHYCAEWFIDSGHALVPDVTWGAILLLAAHLFDCLYTSCLDALFLLN